MRKINNRVNNLGFTLIEILLVMAIIAVLAAIIIIAINPAERLKQARNAKRISDISQIATALETFYTTNGYYPEDDDTSKGESAVAGVDCWDDWNAGTTTLGSSHKFLQALVTNGDLKSVPIERSPIPQVPPNPGFGWDSCSYRYMRQGPTAPPIGVCTIHYAVIYTSLESQRPGGQDQRPPCMITNNWGEGRPDDWGYAVYLPY